MTMLTAKEISDLRRSLGLTMAEFGERLGGIAVATISRWESGERHPVWKHLVKLNELAEKAKKKPAAVAS